MQSKWSYMLLLVLLLGFHGIVKSQSLPVTPIFESTYDRGEVDPFIYVDEVNSTIGLTYTRFDPGEAQLWPDVYYWISGWTSGTWFHELLPNNVLSMAGHLYKFSNVDDDAVQVISLRTTSDPSMGYRANANLSRFSQLNQDGWNSEDTQSDIGAYTSYRNYLAQDHSIYYLSWNIIWDEAHENPENYILKYSKRNPSGAYNTTQITDGDDLEPWFDLTLGANDVPYFCYIQGTNLKFEAGTTNPIQTIGTIAASPYDFNAKLKKRGSPAIAYNSNSGKTMVVFQTKNMDQDTWQLYYTISSNTTSWSTPELVYSTTNTNIYPFVVADPDNGNFYVAFYRFDDTVNNPQVYLDLIQYSETNQSFSVQPSNIKTLGYLNDGGSWGYRNRPIHMIVDPFDTGSNLNLLVASLKFISETDVNVQLLRVELPSQVNYIFRSQIQDDANEDPGSTFRVTDNTTGTTLDNELNSGGQLSLDPAHQYGAEVTPQIFQNYSYNNMIQDYQHQYWSSDQSQYKLRKTFSPNLSESEEVAKYYPLKTVILSTTAGRAQVRIQDPWLSQNTSDYTEISNGTHQVFLNQNENFYENIPIYSLRAPRYIVDDHNIYPFDHWRAIQNVNLDADYVDNPDTCAVVFTDENAEVQTVYDMNTPVNQIPGYVMEVPEWETLTIPAGGNYQFADHFRMKIAGNLQIGDGSAGVKFSSTSPEPNFGILSNNEPTTLDTLIVIDGENKNIQIQNLEIENAYGAIAIRGTNQTVRLNNVEIAHANIGILLDKLVNADILFDHLKIHDNDLGISFGKQLAAADQESYIDIYWSLFYENKRSSIYMFPTDYFTRPSGGNSHHWLTIVNCTFWEPPSSTSYGAIYSRVPPISGDDDYNNYYGVIDLSVYNTIFQFTGLKLFHHNFRLLQGFSDGNMVYGLDESENPFNNPPALEANPAFNDITQRDFRLHHWSPAIDAGVYDPILIYLDEPAPDDPYDIGALPYRFIRGEIEPGLAVWDGGDVDIIGDLIVPEGSTLDIKAGTHIYVHPGVHVQVAGGQLLSAGNSTDSVVFRSSQTDPWAGIEITKGVGEIKYTNIQQAEKGLVVDQSQGHLSRSTIHQNTSGVILTHTATFDISDNTIRDNSMGLQLLYSPVTVKGNSIQTNEGTGLYLYRSDADVLQNQIQYNRTGVAIENLSNASFVTTEDPNNLSLNNTMTDNSEYGLTIDAGSNPLLGTAQKDAKGFWTGGFNVIHSNQTGDIEAGNKDKVDARLNWWDGKPVIHGSGSLILDPTADDKFGPPKGLSKSVTENDTPADSLDPRVAAAVALELDSAYTEAVQAYQAIIATAPESAIAQTALGGIVRCYYRQDNLAELLNTLTTLSETNAGSALSILADDYAITAQAMLTQYEPAMQMGTEVYSAYEGSEGYAEEAAAVLFEQVLIAADMDSATGLGKWNITTHSQSTQKRLDTIVDRYHNTETAKLVQRLFNKSSHAPVAPTLPTTVTLENAYPNPFNPTTTISYGLPNDQPVTLVVYDLTGRQVKRLVSARQSAGWHQVQWNGTNGSGQQASSGVYFYRLQAANAVKTHKILLVR